MADCLLLADFCLSCNTIYCGFYSASWLIPDYWDTGDETANFQQASFTGACLNHLKALRPQTGAQKAADLGIILDNHNNRIRVIHLPADQRVAAMLRLQAA